MAGYHHRASSLKQSNKSHKSNKSSKRSINRGAGGKIQNARVSIKKKGGSKSNAKANRAHMAKQRRLASKEKVLQTRRSQGRGTISGERKSCAIIPRLVGIVSLSEKEAELETSVRDFVVEASDNYGDISSTKCSASVTAKYGKFKKEGNLTFLTNSSAFYPLYENSHTKEDCSVQAALDLCRVCDIIVFLIDGEDCFKKNDDFLNTGVSIGGTSIATSTTNRYQNDSTDYDNLISTRGDRILAALKAQGLPTPVTILVNTEGDSDDDEMSINTCQSSMRRSVLKQKVNLKKYVSRFATTEFGEKSAKMMELDIPSNDKNQQTMDDSTLKFGKSNNLASDDTLIATADNFHPTRTAFIRSLCTMKASPPKWVSEMPRPYIISDGTHGTGYEYDVSNQELKITGFIRGQSPWNVNSLVHLPNMGTFNVTCIKENNSTLISNKMTKKKIKDSPFIIDENKVLAVCDKTVCESLDMFASPDALDGEQNLIGFDEDDANIYDVDRMEDGAPEKSEIANKGIARPAGWSDYQAAWMDAIKGNDNEEDIDDLIDHGELAKELNAKDDGSASFDMNEEMVDTSRVAYLEQRHRDQKDEKMFPDEVEVKEDENAGDRFARYRSLKSFRKSYWDPKENLPPSYGRIYHFPSFKATQNDVMADMKDVIEVASSLDVNSSINDGDAMEVSDTDILNGFVLSGSFVTITVSVPLSSYNRASVSSLITAVCLLPHENKMSVLHMGLSQGTQCDELGSSDLTVKSKDVLTFRCGWRTWDSRPVFSQNNLNCDKQKFERFLPTDGAFCAASVLGPITYTPCPVLVFRKQQTDGNRMQFIALGSMISADADRIVVKRIILTGYPTRVHKRHATVKYMFYNPDDVNWFKPAGLTTKHGSQGNILESVGDHGTMKCLFDKPIKQHDTVCLPLYKRIYPKYAPSKFLGDEGEMVEQEILVL